VQQGLKFFVAKVNAKKVTFEKGDKAKLSPLRFHYDTEKFSLPVRLGLINAKGAQDLIVHVLARNQRYEVANYKNVTIPTNIKRRGATSRSASPSSTPPSSTRPWRRTPAPSSPSTPGTPAPATPAPAPRSSGRTTSSRFGADALDSKNPSGFVLTRMHARYTRITLEKISCSRRRRPSIGGRGTPNQKADFDEKGSSPGGNNNFQGRYAILHRWEGEAKCDNPQRGIWGGPPNGGGNQVKPAQDLASAPRGKVQLTSLIRQEVPELKLKPSDKAAPVEPPKVEPAPAQDAPKADPPAAESAPKEAPNAAPEGADVKDEGCATSPASRTRGASLGALLLLALALLARRGR
jgi:hypothetical protein